MNTSETRRIWTAAQIEQERDAYAEALMVAERERDAARARCDVLEAALERIASIASGTATSSSDLQGATYAELLHIQIASAALAATRPQEGV